MDSSLKPFALGLLTGIFATVAVVCLSYPKKSHPNETHSGNGEIAFEKGDDDCFSLFYEPSETREEGKPFLMAKRGTCSKEVERKMRVTQKEYKYLPDLIYASCVENLTLLCVGTFVFDTILCVLLSVFSSDANFVCCFLIHFHSCHGQRSLLQSYRCDMSTEN